MSSDVVNQIPFLRTSREFPEEAKPLVVEVNKSYVDIANAVNNRTIGIFPTNRPAITGESWFLTSNRQQTLRQMYPITGAGSFNHGINTANIAGFTKIYGTFTNGTNWYPIAYVDIVAANQVSIFVTPTQVTITRGAGAPAITSGFVVLEWLSNP